MVQWSAFILIPWRRQAFFNYKFTSKQREADNWQLLFVSMIMVSMLYPSLVELKNGNQKSSSLYWYIRRRLRINVDKDKIKTYVNIEYQHMKWDP